MDWHKCKGESNTPKHEVRFQEDLSSKTLTLINVAFSLCSEYKLYSKHSKYILEVHNAENFADGGIWTIL
jgi:hypothetical protein